MKFTEEEIKEGEELIDSVISLPVLKDVGGMDRVIAIPCAIIAQKAKVYELEDLLVLFNPERIAWPIINGRIEKAKRVLQYLESL